MKATKTESDQIQDDQSQDDKKNRLDMRMGLDKITELTSANDCWCGQNRNSHQPRIMDVS